jgi:hypothetical protein
MHSGTPIVSELQRWNLIKTFFSLPDIVILLMMSKSHMKSSSNNLMKFIALILMVWQQFQLMQISAEHSLEDSRRYYQIFLVILICTINIKNLSLSFGAC